MFKKQFYQKSFGITNPEILDAFSRVSSVKHVPKGEILIPEGAFHPNIYLLIKGVLRGFWSNTKGKEATECFIFRYGQPATGSYRLDDLALAGIHTEVDTTLLQITKEDFGNLTAQYPELVLLYNQMLVQEMEEQSQIKHTIYMLNAKERYEWFLQNYSELHGLVSFKHIASFLNMSPVTLSRIRASLGEI